MKRINVYAITYNNAKNINDNINLFFHTTKHVDPSQYQLTYHVINNHSNFSLTEENTNRVKVFHNWLRPDHSCGHLTRDYNMGLLHGFKDLNRPAVDQVILLHDDSMWNDTWFDDLQEIHKTYTFYAGDWGDGMTSYLPDAVKNIGIWDERFCNIGYHEADYFLRAMIYNRNKSTINDAGAARVLNPTKEIFYHGEVNVNKVSSHNASMAFHSLTRGIFAKKWNNYPTDNWDINNLPAGPSIDTYMFYPYFEKDIYDLHGKGYIC